jgi:hypothetical protein
VSSSVDAIPDVAWFVNKPSAVDEQALGDYLARSSWASPTPADHAALLVEMRLGQPIALKSVTNLTTGLPFFNADRPVSTMTVHATGRVRSVDVATGTVGITWSPLHEPRNWYFWVAIRSLWRVRPEKEMPRALLEFTFNGAAQDIDLFLLDPYWANRYPKAPRFSWIPFYIEVTTRLADFSNRRPELLDALIEAAASEPLLAYLTHDRFSDGTTAPMKDIDPFTVMGTFNRGITEDNRRRVAKIIADIVGAQAEVPTDFDGIPILNNQQSWFIRYSRDRGPNDVDKLWDVFMAGLAFSGADSPENRRTLATAYDSAQQVSGVKWNLSQGLYWARPNTFATIEGQSRPFIRSHFDLAIPADGQGYLELIDQLRTRFDSGTTSITSFPELSYAAWSRGQPSTPPTVAGFAWWAARMAESVDLDTDEHNYKRATAKVMRLARDQARQGNQQWATTFKQAMTEADNLLHYMFKDDVVKAVAADPMAWSALFEAVWTDPQPRSLDEFRGELLTLLPKVTPGNATGLGALLLLADDPEANAPYLTSRTEKWYRLTSFSGPADDSSPTDRYATMLRFLDALATELELLAGMPVSRLEAQGAAWATTEHSMPTEWDDATRAAFRAFLDMGYTEPPRAWLVRPKEVPVEKWIDEGYVSVAATWLGNVEPRSDLKTVKAAVESGYQQVESIERQSLTGDYHAFLSRMRPDDLVCTNAESQLRVGRIVSEATYHEVVHEDRLRRDVDWQSAVPTETLPSALLALLDQQGTVVELTDSVDFLQELVRGSHDPEPAPPLPPAPPVALRPATEALAGSLYMDATFLQEALDVLGTRKQVVLYGPPGTGKTFVALAIARHIVGEDNTSHQQLVQFHPSYAYEDFFEGYRPDETASGQATFRIQPGPLRRIAADAKANPGQPFVLIIDEMNRANLASVFGELYFLLEYRDQTIRLQYNPSETFRLPPNLYVIGTMNTADRSIALLDSAMRRRFAFVELHPDESPVRDVLGKFLTANHKPDDPRADLLAALNAAIEDTDRDFKIGPSYLMRPEAETEAGLDRIWRYDILPLLEEHYYGRTTRAEVHERFGLTNLRHTLNIAAAISQAKNDDLTPGGNPQPAGNASDDEAVSK